MSGGAMRKHTRCRKSKKWDGSSPICKVCGYRVFYEDNQKLYFNNPKERKGDSHKNVTEAPEDTSLYSDNGKVSK